MKNKISDRFQLDRIAFYGRTLAEYLKMFNLDLSVWKDCKILDCPSGASSFVAEAKRLGFRAAGCDPLFGDEPAILFERGKADIEHVIERVSRVPHLYKWEFYPSMDTLKKCRTLALHRFAEDYPAGIAQKRYIKAELPRLPFEDESFDLVLSGHFLFLYSDMFDYPFHTASVQELFRVCSREVRIYPIQGPDARPYEHIERLLSDLKNKGIIAEIIPVPFEFQRGSNRMLRLSKSLNRMGPEKDMHGRH